jgi:hypothetical protein
MLLFNNGSLSLVSMEASLMKRLEELEDDNRWLIKVCFMKKNLRFLIEVGVIGMLD